MTPLLAIATLFMQEAHRSIDQRRKDNVRPYEVHPLGVMRRVQKVTDDENVLIAALFHDIVEDVFPKNPFYSLANIREGFGETVMFYVEQLTDVYTKENHPDKNRRTRKQLERERYSTFSPEVKWIKLADIAENLEDDGSVLHENGLPEVGFNRMFIKEKALCLPYLLVPNDPRNVQLYKEANRILEAQAKKFDVRLNSVRVS